MKDCTSRIKVLRPITKSFAKNINYCTYRLKKKIPSVKFVDRDKSRRIGYEVEVVVDRKGI